ncbi:VWA domain-containing protein [Actinomadura graeca]|uniref:VWA domain-containing protein n=1 Tax=Actinomadura graeca TaxID=2750812 RepID=A0ABX8R5C1_9ACTN|nr:vWA domain-containing protein [Actinomadura graeca]QXJ25721.1 VWA domain-containing protein [Actinomadura graeca]
MTAPHRFGLEVRQDPQLFTAATELHAVLEVSAAAAPDAGTSRWSEILIIDCSSSMGARLTPGRRGQKIKEARRATAAAIDVLRDGVCFAVIEGTEEATVIYPETSVLAVASPASRAEAKAAVARSVAYGNTHIGSWLRKADELLRADPSAIQHVLLLTDGCDNAPPGHLEQALAGCESGFVCDALGIGEGWDADQLLKIVSARQGSATAVSPDADLAAYFERTTRAAMRRTVAELRLRVTTTPPATLLGVRQVHPTTSDLTDRVERTGDRTVEVPTGPWGEEVRDYQLTFQVSSADAPLYEDLRVARIDAVVDARPQAAPAAVVVEWGDEPDALTHMDPVSTYYTAHENMSQAVDLGIRAYEDGDHPAAGDAWGRAVRLAWQTGGKDLLAELERFVEILDPRTGVVRIRSGIRPHDINVVKIAVTHTTRGRGEPTPADVPSRTAPWECKCGRRSPASASFCTACGRTPPPEAPGTLGRG